MAKWAIVNIEVNHTHYSYSSLIVLYFYSMQFSSSLLENAVNEFARLPGIGKKTALRMVLHLLKQDEATTENFSEVIAKNA